MSKFKQTKTPEETISELKRQNLLMKNLLEEAIKGKYGVWSYWVERVKTIIKEVNH